MQWSAKNSAYVQTQKECGTAKVGSAASQIKHTELDPKRDMVARTIDGYGGDLTDVKFAYVAQFERD